MKKQVKNLIAILIAGGVLTGGVASAESYKNVENDSTSLLSIMNDNMIAPRFTGLSDTYKLLELESNDGCLYCLAYTRTYSSYTAYIKVELQQYDSGWSTIKTWSHNPKTTYAYVEKNYYVGDGRYRLKVTHKAYNSSGTAVDSVVSYSDEITY